VKVSIISCTPDPEQVCARAASICYKSEPSIKVLKHCLEAGHLSIFEHASITFLIEGISRVTSHQLVRHRIGWSYSQVSQRYTGCSREDVIIPPELTEHKKDLDNVFDIAYKTYQKLLNQGAKKEDARYVLPNAATTDIVATANLRALLNYFPLRLCKRAQWEIRDMSYLMLDHCKRLAPNVFENVGPGCKYCIDKCTETKEP